jgi:hypothetical protein
LYGHLIYFLKTFVDPERFRGTCYREANWTLLGRTTGGARMISPVAKPIDQRSAGACGAPALSPITEQVSEVKPARAIEVSSAR